MIEQTKEKGIEGGTEGLSLSKTISFYVTSLKASYPSLELGGQGQLGGNGPACLPPVARRCPSLPYRLRVKLAFKFFPFLLLPFSRDVARFLFGDDISRAFWWHSRVL